MIYILGDGSSLQLSLNYGALYRLREKDPQLYKRFDDARKRAVSETEEYDTLFDVATVLYTAYVCGPDYGRERWDYERFLDAMQESLVGNMEAMAELLNPKKQRPSAKPSGRPERSTAGT